MIKLSRISKVFLIVGLLLAFSGTLGYASQECDKKYNENVAAENADYERERNEILKEYNYCMASEKDECQKKYISDEAAKADCINKGSERCKRYRDEDLKALNNEHERNLKQAISIKGTCELESSSSSTVEKSSSTTSAQNQSTAGGSSGTTTTQQSQSTASESKTKSQEKVDKARQKAEERSEKANETQAKMNELVGTGSWETTERTSTQVIGAGANGSSMTTETKTGTRTQDGSGNKIVKDANGNYSHADGTAVSEWEQVSLKKNDAQNAYTSASVSYNKCVAQKGASATECLAAKEKMNTAKANLDFETQNYNDVQKAASKAYYENEKAQAKAEKAQAKAEAAALKADQKDLKSAEKALKECQKSYRKGEVASCADKEEAVAKAQDKVDAHTKKADSVNTINEDASISKALEKYNQAAADLSSKQDEYDSACGIKDEKGNITGYKTDASCTKKKEELNKVKESFDQEKGAFADARGNLENEYNEAVKAAKAANEECEKYSAMTSKDAQAKAKEACARATQLDEKVSQLKKLRDSTKGNGPVYATSNLTGVNAAKRRLKTLGNADYSGGEDRGGFGVVDISKSRPLVGPNIEGTTSGYNFDYSNGGDALETITRRAALALAALKPIIYVFAGFGLIAFAWMAIFGKLSWKWFANIAMGLFLVANMGRFIEYFVADGGQAHYYVGAWNSGRKDGTNKLANAFHDIYYVYGDTTYNAKGLRNYVEEADIQSTTGLDAFSPNARGFCQGTSASGWANFTTCLKDIVATGKKAVDAVQSVKAAVDDVKARVETVTDTFSNIKSAVNNIHSFSDAISSTGVILGNVNAAVSTTTGAVGSLTNSASRVTNDIQDIGKSTDRQRELADRRALGEATNAVDATLKGQEYNKTTGGVEKVDGKYAGKSNVLTTIQKGANSVRDKSATVNGAAQDAVQQGSSVLRSLPF